MALQKIALAPIKDIGVTLIKEKMKKKIVKMIYTCAKKVIGVTD